MSYPQEPQRAFTPFGNPFRRIIPKGSSLSPHLLGLLTSFEETLTRRIDNIKPANRDDVLTLSWMRTAVESLCAIQADVKNLIVALELPISDWDDKWIDVYLDNSVKLLDICIAFSSEISRMKQGHLFLQCVLHNLSSPTSLHQITWGDRVHSFLDGWEQHIGSKNPRLEKCFSIMDSLARKLNLPKIKNSSKGQVLMRAMYGVKVVTLFICSIFAAALSGSSKALMDIQVPGSYLWEKAFTNLQTFINSEIRNGCSSGGLTLLKEVEAVNAVVKKVYPIVQDSFVEAGVLQNYRLDLERSVEVLADGLEVLVKEVDGFFQVVLTGRDALLCNLKIGGCADAFGKLRTEGNGGGQTVR